MVANNSKLTLHYLLEQSSPRASAGRTKAIFTKKLPNARCQKMRLAPHYIVLTLATTKLALAGVNADTVTDKITCFQLQISAQFLSGGIFG